MATQEINFKDFQSKIDPTWCPGCGDFGILNAVQKAMAELELKKENTVVVSGIGCSSRFPYFMNTYGFHTIHGRGLAVATGVKMANPKLNVWHITGDGDSMSIGGNHFIHAIRRNFDINVIQFNNKIYGLTKGQFSPTTDKGSKTKTSPFGTLEEPFVSGNLVMGARGTFFARAIDRNVSQTKDIMIEATRHKGLSVIEVLQNCVIFTNGIHDAISKDKEESQIYLQHGKKMLFGKGNDKGLIMENGRLKVVKIGENGITEDDILVHDAVSDNFALHSELINMKLPDFPVAIGVIRSIPSPTYDEMLYAQIEEVKSTSKVKTLNDLFYASDTWEIK